MKTSELPNFFDNLYRLREKRDHLRKTDYDRYTDLAHYIDGINHTLNRLQIKDPRK